MGLLADELKENQTYTYDSTFFETRSKFYERQDFIPRQYYFMVFFTDRFKARTQMEIDALGNAYRWLKLLAKIVHLYKYFRVTSQPFG